MVLKLGVDVGTTSIKVCIVQELTMVSSAERPHNADVYNSSSDTLCQWFEQDIRLIVKALDHCLDEVTEYLSQIETIAICGQMHGVVLWQPRESTFYGSGNYEFDCLETVLNETVGEFSNLYTWQDRRCNQSFFDSLPESPSSCSMSTGYGWPTMLWLRRNTHDLERFSMCGTIMDFLVWLLTRTEHVVMSTHNAKSWGYFDLSKGCWEISQLEEITSLNLRLPKIAVNNWFVMKAISNVHGLNKANLTVNVALGDMQCAIRSTSPSCSEAVLNIGTSSQLSVLIKRDRLDLSEILKQNSGLDCVPYDDEHVVITAASLNGGNVLKAFVTNIQSWFTDIDCAMNLTTRELFDKIEHLGKTYKDRVGETETKLQINPSVFGERHNPDLLGSVTHVTSRNLSLGSITLAVYKGVIDNLLQMLPVPVLKHFGFKTLVGTGGTLSRSELMREVAMETFQTTIRMSTQTEAAYGAVLFSSAEIPRL